MTAPAVRAALALDWGAPFAVAYDGLVFRRQRDPARESEFRQIGMERFDRRDAIGTQDEATIIAAALDACRKAGVAPRLRLGDVALFEALIEAQALGDAWTRRFKRAFARPGGLAATLKAAAEGDAAQRHPLGQALAALSEERATAVVEEMLADARIVNVGARSIADIVARLREKGRAETAPPPSAAALAAIAEGVSVDAPPDAAWRALERLARTAPEPTPLVAALERCAERCRAVPAAETLVSPGFGRGLAYYDGFVFELEAPALGDRASVGGGGRYDGLLHRIAAAEGGGPDRPEAWGALGFALRPARLMEAAQ